MNEQATTSEHCNGKFLRTHHIQKLRWTMFFNFDLYFIY